MLRLRFGTMVRRLVIPFALVVVVLVCATTAPAHRDTKRTTCAPTTLAFDAHAARSLASVSCSYAR